MVGTKAQAVAGLSAALLLACLSHLAIPGAHQAGLLTDGPPIRLAGGQLLSPVNTASTQPTLIWNGLPERYKFDPFTDEEVESHTKNGADPFGPKGQYGTWMGIQGDTINSFGCGPKGPKDCFVGTTPSEHWARRPQSGGKGSARMMKQRRLGSLRQLSGTQRKGAVGGERSRSTPQQKLPASGLSPQEFAQAQGMIMAMKKLKKMHLKVMQMMDPSKIQWHPDSYRLKLEEKDAKLTSKMHQLADMLHDLKTKRENRISNGASTGASAGKAEVKKYDDKYLDLNAPGAPHDEFSDMNAPISGEPDSAPYHGANDEEELEAGDSSSLLKESEDTGAHSVEVVDKANNFHATEEPAKHVRQRETAVVGNELPEVTAKAAETEIDEYFASLDKHTKEKHRTLIKTHERHGAGAVE